VLVYECRLGGPPQPDGVETLELGWKTSAELAELELSPWGRTVLPEIFAGQRTA
jgi:hypothetical protein